MVVLQYKPEEWRAMGHLKTQITFMKQNNTEVVFEDDEGNKQYRYDNALQRQKKALKYFFTEVPERF